MTSEYRTPPISEREMAYWESSAETPLTEPRPGMKRDLYQALHNFGIVLSNADRLYQEFAGAMRTLERRGHEVARLIQSLPKEEPPSQEAMEIYEHYGTQPDPYRYMCPMCHGTFNVSNPEKLAEVSGLCPECWKNTQDT